VLDYCPFYTDQLLKVRWYHFLRPERKFESLDQLKAQIGQDVEDACKYWNR
ncbi:MAG: hypothetical protein KJT03_06665, partial [Verrucomicrobiae bacterium]|nr:hypothetical protein [Verrucomicrobiae bacterium]